EAMVGGPRPPRRAKEGLLGGGKAAGPATGAATPTSSSGRHAQTLPSDAPTAMARGLGLPPIAPAVATGEPRLMRASVPLSVSGFTPRTVAELADELRPTGLVPLQAGGRRQPGPPAAGGRGAGAPPGRRAAAGRRGTGAT